MSTLREKLTLRHFDRLMERFVREQQLATPAPKRRPRGEVRTARQIRSRAAAMRGRKANVSRMLRERA